MVLQFHLVPYDISALVTGQPSSGEALIQSVPSLGGNIIFIRFACDVPLFVGLLLVPKSCGDVYFGSLLLPACMLCVLPLPIQLML